MRKRDKYAHTQTKSNAAKWISYWLRSHTTFALCSPSFIELITWGREAFYFSLSVYLCCWISGEMMYCTYDGFPMITPSCWRLIPKQPLNLPHFISYGKFKAIIHEDVSKIPSRARGIFHSETGIDTIIVSLYKNKQKMRIPFLYKIFKWNSWKKRKYYNVCKTKYTLFTCNRKPMHLI